MREWLRGKAGGLAAFLLICGLVAGGLGWATAAALRLEGEQLAGRAEAERDGRLRLALWRLDSDIAPLLAIEDGRPFNHYSAVFATPLAFNNRGTVWRPGAVVEPSPLLSADLPDWMLLHFQLDATSGWESPQAPSANLSHVLQKPPLQTSLGNATTERVELLDRLKHELAPGKLLAVARERVAPISHNDKVLVPAQRPPDMANNGKGNPFNQDQQFASNGTNTANNDYNMRQQVVLPSEARAAQKIDRSLAFNSLEHNGENWLAFNTPVAQGAEVLVHLTPMTSLWMPTDDGRERLLLVRLVRIEDKEVCQGVVLDDAYLCDMLAAKVADLFPAAKLLPVHEPEPPRPERAMTTLPLQLDPGPVDPVADPGWTPLRVGLALAWAAALVALLAVGLGGWSLIDLSERRIRFVSAVTHELRTPLTTLRLYLDMLMNGLVRDEKQREEYIRTLNAEANRLSRLVGNVLDFSRLEKQRPNLKRAPVRVADLLARLRDTWQGRCQDADKELVIENALGDEAVLDTDADLVQQVVGNLLDNACKYSRGAADRRIRLRVRGQGRRVVVEVADGGPGVPARERRAIFRAFRRGRGADVTAGGVGLGLALARRWSRLLGGKLTLHPAPAEGGACFRLYLPAGGPS